MPSSADARAQKRRRAEWRRARRAERERATATIARLYWSQLDEIGLDDWRQCVRTVAASLGITYAAARNLLSRTDYELC